ncbi:MAG: IS1595 family transposase [Neisseria sp.]|nr:IS1595 family transposase [Neisseria sp.]
MSYTQHHTQFLQQEINKLPEADKQALIQSLIESIAPPDTHQTQAATHCSHCQSQHIVKNGTKNNKQRHLCRHCHKTFYDPSPPLLHHTHKKASIWAKYINSFLEAHPLRRCAKECRISLQTAFYWRHKILFALQHKMQNEMLLNNIVQADETYVNISYKGNHKHFKLPREARKRGKDTSYKATTPNPTTHPAPSQQKNKRGISSDKLCVSCAIDNSRHSFAKVSNKGRPSIKNLLQTFQGKIARSTIFITDSHQSYRKVAKQMALNHYSIPSGQNKIGEYHIQTMNYYHREFKDMIIHRFKGVASKYLNNYIAYHDFLNFFKESLENKRQILFDFIKSTTFKMTNAEIPNRKAIPI